MNYKLICVRVGSTCADAPEHNYITSEDEWVFMKLFIDNFNEIMMEKYGTDYEYDLCEVLCDVAENITPKQLEKFNYTNYARMRNKIINYEEDKTTMWNTTSK